MGTKVTIKCKGCGTTKTLEFAKPEHASWTPEYAENAGWRVVELKRGLNYYCPHCQ